MLDIYGVGATTATQQAASQAANAALHEASAGTETMSDTKVENNEEIN